MVLLRVSPGETTFNTGNFYSRSLKKSSCWRKLILQRFVRGNAALASVLAGQRNHRDLQEAAIFQGMMFGRARPALPDLLSIRVRAG